MAWYGKVKQRQGNAWFSYIMQWEIIVKRIYNCEAKRSENSLVKQGLKQQAETLTIKAECLGLHNQRFCGKVD